MGILNIEPVKAAVSHSASVSGGRSYSVQLLAFVEDHATGPIAIRSHLAALGFVAGATYRWPLGGEATETDPGAFLQSIDISPDAPDGLQSKVTLQYGPLDPVESSGAVGDSVTGWIMAPWTAAPTLRWSSEDEDYAVTHDREGNPILNTAGDPFDPAIIVPMSTPIAVVTRIEKGFDHDWIKVFKNTVNNAPWLDFPTGSALCKDITADRVYDPDWGVLWTVTYTYAFRPVVKASNVDETVIIAGWDRQILNAGLRELKAGVKSPILQKGAPVTSPIPLDEDGAALSPTADPVYLTFPVYPERDFSFFNMPDDLFSASTP